jgi:SAM-dependent methyltransferase
LNVVPAKTSAKDTAEDTQMRLRALLDENSMEGVNQEIHPGDTMYEYNHDWYYPAGFFALRSIRLAMLAAKKDTVTSILDLPSGYGRCLRVFKAAFPDAELTACDIDKRGVEFCAETLGAMPVEGKDDPKETELTGPYDLIWCGSLLTHVGEPVWIRFIKKFESVLAPGGILVFTTFGRMIVERRLRPLNDPLSFNEEQTQQVIEDYERTGFGYCNSLGVGEVENAPSDYGDCVATPAWVCQTLQEQTPSLEFLLYLEGGWGMKRDEWAQDVIACIKRVPDDSKSNSASGASSEADDVA